MLPAERRDRARKTCREQDNEQRPNTDGLAQFKRGKDTKWTDDIAGLIKKGDEALYKAKQCGRNQVVTSDSL